MKHSEEASEKFGVAMASTPHLPDGSLDATNLSTVMTAVENHPALRGRLHWNSDAEQVEVDGEPMANWHVIEFRGVLHGARLKAPKSMVRDSMIALAHMAARQS